MAKLDLLQGGDDRRPRLRRGVPRVRDQEGSMIPVRSLAGGVEPLRQWFNDKSGFARLVAIQSPT